MLCCIGLDGHLNLRGNTMLYDVTRKPDREVLPDDLLKSEYLKKAVKEINPVSFEKMCRTLDLALDNQKPSASSNLIWTKFGALVGHSSGEPCRDINHLWEKGIDAFGESKVLMKFMGTLLMWRISLRKETWLVYRQETNNVDPDTGKTIFVCNYWIDDLFTPVEDVEAPTLENLMAKFNKKK